jgi:hypothetical protein
MWLLPVVVWMEYSMTLAPKLKYRYKFSGASESALKLIRILGLSILLCLRLPVWFYTLTSVWFAPDWSWRTGMPAIEP